MTARTTRVGVALSALVLLLAVCFCVPSVRGAIASAFNDIVYYNDIVNADSDHKNDWNFGPDRKAQAEDAIKAGTTQAKDVLQYVADGETGDFYHSIATDPALCAAVALHLDETVELPEKILVDEQDVIIGQRADAAHKHFLEDQEYWDRAVALIKEYTSHAEASIQHVNKYTSSMYMWNNHLDGNKPSVVVRNTQNAGGDALVFDFGKPGVVKFRLQCGYQPIDVPYWPTPDVPDIPDNPEPEPDEPKLQPKDPNAGPQGQVPNNPDFGGGPNHGNNTELTEEPTSPDTYTPPERPKAETPQDNGQKPNPPDDHNNGGTETHDGKDYEVVVGDGTEKPDLADVVDNEHGKDTVEKPVADDGVNTGDLDESNVE